MPVSIAMSDLRLPPRAGVVLVATTLLLAACSRPAPPEEPVRSVKVMTVGAGALDTTREYAGEVKARVESRLGFRVGGKLTQRPAEVGQRVRPGQLLALLDPQDLTLAVDAARAQVVAATTQRDLALADFRRFQSLKDQNFISAAELERREATLRAAQATLDQAQAQLAAQGNQAGYTRLLADVAGVVTAVDAEVGQVVGAGAPVVRVAQDGARDVVFAVPEDRVTALRVGQAVTVRPWSGGATLAGTVRELAASADPVTRTFAVKVALPASDGLPLGATVSVLVQALSGAAPAAAIKLPTSALRQEGQGSAVWLLDAASLTVRSQPVQVLTADGNEAVIGAGLQPGQQVVVAGVHVLSPGQKVTVYQPKSAEPSVERSSSAMKSGASAPFAAASVPAVPAAATSAAR